MSGSDHPFRPAEAESVDESTEIEDGEGEPPCQVAGCGRPGSVPRAVDHVDGELVQQYVCQYHRRLFLAVKTGVVLVGITLFVVAFFQLY